MSADDVRSSKFEQRASALLEESATSVNARVRSRLNQARHTALEELARTKHSFWRKPLVVMPATGAIAATVLVAILASSHFRGEHALPGSEGGQAAMEDIEMLADNDGLELVENGDGFYEWAAAQSDDGDGSSG